MAYENTGYLAFANALNNAGQTFATTLQKRDELKSLADLAKLAPNNEMGLAAKSALEGGNQDIGLKLWSLAYEQQKTSDQRAYDAKAFARLNGNADDAPVGATGGVTPNPNPQPMQLPGASTDASLPRGMRNLNPGNIEDGPFARSQAGYVGNDGRFAKFDTMEHGVAAQAGLLGSYANKGINTLSGIINRYAPPSENGKATQNYMQFVARKIGVDPNAPLDLSDPNMRQKVALAMSEFENGRPVLGGGPKPVQVADASGAIPQSAVPGQAPQQPQADPSARLMAKRDNIMLVLSQEGISDNARQQLTTMLSNINSDLTRLEKNKPDVKQFGDTIYRVDQQGNLTPVQKVEKSAQEKALTEGQSNAALFSDRMINAEKVISDPVLSKSAMGLSGTSNKTVENLPLGLGGRVQTNEFKRYQRAKRDFIAAALRKESGAKIDNSEFEGADQMWFPQPWDDEQTISDKATARQVEIEGMRRAVPAGTKLGQEPASVAPGAVDHLARARKAIADGIPRDEVLRTLQTLKVDPGGL